MGFNNETTRYFLKIWSSGEVFKGKSHVDILCMGFTAHLTGASS